MKNFTIFPFDFSTPQLDFYGFIFQSLYSMTSSSCLPEKKKNENGF